MIRAFTKERIFKALNEKGAIQSFLCRKLLFDLFQTFGFHIHGDHFYEVIPNTKELERNFVDTPRPLPGIEWDFISYEQLTLELISRYGREFSSNIGNFGYKTDSFYFLGHDALMLYLLIRHRKPRKVVEIGQGDSTKVILSALERNSTDPENPVASEFTSVDPYARLEALPERYSFKVNLVRQPVQSLNPADLVRGCDFFFADTTHAYRYGSEVEFIFLHILDKLERGTLIHVHDIYSPYDYPCALFTKMKRFWNEQYILENFLRYNSEFTPTLPVYSLFRDSCATRDALASLPLPAGFQPSGASFYFERRA